MKRADQRLVAVQVQAPPPLRPMLDNREGSGIEADRALLSTLASADVYGAGARIEISRIEVECLSEPQPGAPTQDDESAVPETGGRSRRSGANECTDLIGSRDFNRARVACLLRAGGGKLHRVGSS